MKQRSWLVLFALLVGCVHSYDVPEPTASSILPGSKIYVSRAPDGRDNRPRTYSGSGAQLTDAIAQELHSRGYRVIYGAKTEDFKNSVVTARENNASYVVFPRITLWEDRATEWSGLRDTVHISLRTLDSAGETIDSRRIEAHSRWLTFGGDHPQDLLPRLVEEWASGLF